MFLFQSSRLMSQLDDFATENSVGAGALKNVFKSLLSIPNSKLFNGKDETPR